MQELSTIYVLLILCHSYWTTQRGLLVCLHLVRVETLHCIVLKKPAYCGNLVEQFQAAKSLILHVSISDKTQIGFPLGKFFKNLLLFSISNLFSSISLCMSLDQLVIVNKTRQHPNKSKTLVYLRLASQSFVYFIKSGMHEVAASAVADMIRRE